MQVVLVMFRADGDRRSFPLSHSISVLGRREDCDLRIPLADVSRKHCRVIVEEDSAKIEDLGSSNGTFVNGERVQEKMLQPGDTLGVGPVAFVVQIDGVPAEEDIQAPVVNPNTDTSLTAMPSDDSSVGSGVDLASLEDSAGAPLDLAGDSDAPAEK